MSARAPRPAWTFRGAAILAVGAIALAGCGRGYADTGHASAAGPAATVSTSPAPASAASAPATVKVASAGIGQVLVDANGMTLYRFDKDSGTTSSCNGDCALNWPALTVTGQPAGAAALAGSLGVTTGNDGTTHVTYQGHPLYRFSGDHRPGDTNGDGIGGTWHAVRPGSPASGASAATTATTAASSSSY